MIRTAGPSDYDASSPYQEGDLELVIESLGEERAGKVLHDNARRFYRCGER